MTGLTVKDIARLVGGVSNGDGAASVRDVVIDSRQAGHGSMFAALPGEKADGHDYITKALDAGAACCLALRVPEGERRPVITVPDVAKALAVLAEKYRKMFSLPVIGIVGSVGKTTSKEMVAAVLSQKYKVLKTEKNLNNELGVPLTLFRLSPEYGAAVIEMGISDFGEMTRLAKMVRPDMVVYTVIGASHLDNLHDRAGVLKAKTELLPFLRPQGTVFVNGDDDMLAGLDCRRRKISFGIAAENDVRAENIASDADSTDCEIVLGDRRIPVTIPAYGRQMVYAALSGAAVGLSMGLDDAAIARGIASYKTVGRRASVIDTGFVTLVDDCYNANPNSVKCAVDSLKMLPGRKVCVLGDMLGLGESGERLHLEVGQYAGENGAELILTAGELARDIDAGAAKTGAQTVHFDTSARLIAALPEYIKKGDAVLVKASHAMKFEEVSEAIKKLL